MLLLVVDIFDNFLLTDCIYLAIICHCCWYKGRKRMPKKEDVILEDIKLDEALLAKDFIEFPGTLNKICTKEEFHKMMTSHNSDIPIESVNFVDYPNNKTES